MGYAQDYERRQSRKKKLWIIGVVVVVVVVVVAVVPAVVVTNNKKQSRYPDYTRLNYTLRETYSGSNFWDKFDYFEGYDPAHGFVHYVPRERAMNELNLTSASTTSAVLKVDTSVGPSSPVNASTGRFSVRAESKATYNSGLFLFDVLHAPYGCATWPALWLTDRDTGVWPSHGEIDVMEAVNQAAAGNLMSLHTSGGCTMADVRRNFTGAVVASDGKATNCDSGPGSKTGNMGCGVQASSPATYGQAFNALGGGVMALEWRREGIRMWQFPRAAGLPADVLAKQPDPSSWPAPLADFPGTECDIGSHFKNQSLIVNIDLCGDLVYPGYATSGCPSPKSCNDFVANNPEAFQTAFWEFASFEVYQPL